MNRQILNRVSLLAKFTLLLCVIALSIPACAQKDGLTLAQIERLVQLNNPDNVIAGAIESRGVAFVVNPKVLETLRRAGAGDQTIAAVRQRMQSATIVLGEGTPSAAVLIDGQRMSQYGPGFPSSLEVAIGKHHITVSLENYRTLDLEVNLTNKQVYRLDGNLEWSGGRVQVDVVPVMAFLAITPKDPNNSRYGSKTDQRSGGLNSAVVPGDYSVVATIQGYTPAAQTVTVHAGETVRVHLVLQKDDAYFKRRIAAMQSQLDDRTAADILQRSNRLAADDPADPDLFDLRTRAALLSGNMQDFQSIALDGLRAGQTVSIPLQHIHLGFKDTKHAARLSLTSKGFSYDSLGNACTQVPFTESWSSLQTMQFGRTAAGMPILSLHLKLATLNGKSATLSFTEGDQPFNSSGPQNDENANRLQGIEELLRLEKERDSGTN